MRKLMLAGIVLLMVLALGASEAQAASCVFGNLGPGGGTHWTIRGFASGFFYSVSATGTSSYSFLFLKVYRSCWRDTFGQLWCSGTVGQSGPGRFVSVTFLATQYSYHAIVTGRGSYQLCVR